VFSLPPPCTAAATWPEHLREQGYAVLHPTTTMALAAGQRLDAWPAFWNDLPPDAHLRDGGRYRRRRHGCFVLQGDQVQAVPHRAHWQPTEYNALHGGFERWFEPLLPAFVADAAFQGLMRGLVAAADGLRAQPPGSAPWFAEVHPFRIDTTDGIGRPTPEGAHRDGVDLVAVMLVARQGVRGGETRVFAADSPQGLRFTMAEPGTLLLLDDARMIHETTPIQPMAGEAPNHRDTLVITLRAGGFQGP
jgi:hypothetical protein